MSPRSTRPYGPPPHGPALLSPAVTGYAPGDMAARAVKIRSDAWWRAHTQRVRLARQALDAADIASDQPSGLVNRRIEPDVLGEGGDCLRTVGEDVGDQPLQRGDAIFESHEFSSGGGFGSDTVGRVPEAGQTASGTRSGASA